MEEFESRPHHFEPLSVFQVVLVVREILSGVVWRVNENALDGAGVMRDERFESEEVVTLDEEILSFVVAVCFVDGGKSVKRSAGGSPNVGVACVPVECGHGVILPSLSGTDNFPAWTAIPHPLQSVKYLPHRPEEGKQHGAELISN